MQFNLPSPQPQSQQENQWTPPSPKPFVWDTFAGVNTKPSRTGIEDQQMYWCDGFMPLGKNNLRTLYGVGTAIFDATSTGKTVVWFDFGNIGATNYCYVMLSDGSLRAVNVATGASTTIAAAGTITTPTVGNISFCQSGSQFAIFVANQSNGLFVWDGTNFYQPGTLGPDVDIKLSGLGYSSVPTMTAWGGNGTGATFAATVTNGYIQTLSVTNPGSGYQGYDIPVILFNGGGSSARSAKLQSVLTGGTVSAINIVDGGYGYTSTVTGAVVGGGGAGAAFAVTSVTGSAIAAVSITAAGAGYLSAPTAYVTDGNSPVPVALLDTMPSGIGGTGAETYVGRLWVINGPKIQFSAAESLVNFAASAGGGIAMSVDSFLRNAYYGLKNINGFLYLVGDSSINSISNVNQSGSVTTFNNQNADPESGSSWSHSIGTFSRSVIYGNSVGIHVCNGGNVIKASDALDGIYPPPDILASYNPSSAKATIFGRRVWMCLLPLLDYDTQTYFNRLAMTDGQTWWTSLQDVSLTYIASQEINSIYTAYGTDGTKIYPLFAQPSTHFTKKIVSKLWEYPSYIFNKTATRLFGLLNFYSSTGASVSFTIDNENGTSSLNQTIAPTTLTWTNASGGTITWLNNSGNTITWTSSGTGVYVLPPYAVGQQGALLGLTLSTSAADMAVVSLFLQSEMWGYRG